MRERKNKNYSELLYEDIKLLENEGELLSNILPKPEEDVIVEETIRELQNGCFLAMVRRLTLHQRIAFSLIDMFGLSLDEVDRTPSQMLAYQLGWMNLILDWENQEQQGYVAITPTPDYEWIHIKNKPYHFILNDKVYLIFNRLY